MYFKIDMYCRLEMLMAGPMENQIALDTRATNRLHVKAFPLKEHFKQMHVVIQ